MSKKTPNAFILYRREKQSQLRKKYPRMPQRKLSGLVSKMWKRELPCIRGRYESISLMLSITNNNRNAAARQSVGPTDFENGSTHFFVFENRINNKDSLPIEEREQPLSTSDDDEFINSIFNFDL
ncbi:25680_t:CDS:1 [Dentiscutata erythropus]|uniref:25680_t:CDS:1 n=1 Tax=Dentiscutata erythropus TaxID=1348616 RepID=A0A9N9JKX6_9GLOM|nr:25680_t:CDS:1 [Dentiscutata erythropus]